MICGITNQTSPILLSSLFMTLAIDIPNGHGLSNKARHKFFPKKIKGNTVLAVHKLNSSFLQVGMPSGSKACKRRLAYSVTIINFGLSTISVTVVISTFKKFYH